MAMHEHEMGREKEIKVEGKKQELTNPTRHFIVH
jgi:hypothetical protein